MADAEGLSLWPVIRIAGVDWPPLVIVVPTALHAVLDGPAPPAGTGTAL